MQNIVWEIALVSTMYMHAKIHIYCTFKHFVGAFI